MGGFEEGEAVAGETELHLDVTGSYLLLGRPQVVGGHYIDFDLNWTHVATNKLP